MRWLLGVMLVFGLGGVAHAENLRLDGDFLSGGVVRGQVAPGSTVIFAGRPLRVAPDGRFLLGFGREAAGAQDLLVRHPDGREERRALEVFARGYDIQRIDGLPAKQVAPSAADLVRIQAEAGRLGAAKARDSAVLGFAGEMVWPVTGRISGVYGSQRILNGAPRSPHRGMDVAAPAGTPVGAMARGVVSLAETGLYFTGGTVMVDHGHGLHSIYSHLSVVGVAVGQELVPGEVLGKVGATGRATGPHLHWGVYWFDQAVDPALLVGPMPR